MGTYVTLPTQSRVAVSSHLYHTVPFTAAFNVSLKLQGGNCSDQLTLICRHSAVITPPHWIVSGTTNNITGDVLGTAFPGTNYTVENQTEHRAIISGVQALDGHSIQCVYDVLGTIKKSNAVNFSFIPPGQCAVKNVPPAVSTYMSVHIMQLYGMNTWQHTYTCGA